MSKFIEVEEILSEGHIKDRETDRECKTCRRWIDPDSIISMFTDHVVAGISYGEEVIKSVLIIEIHGCGDSIWIAIDESQVDQFLETLACCGD